MPKPKESQDGSCAYVDVMGAILSNITEIEAGFCERGKALEKPMIYTPCFRLTEILVMS